MDQHRFAIATISLGWHESHSLPEKLNAAAQNGYQGIEMVYPNLEREAAAQNQTVEECAVDMRALCDKLNLKVVALGAFENYEGSLEPLSLRLGKATKWVNLARILQAEFIQIPASYEVTSLRLSEDEIVNELRLLADCGLPKEGSGGATITFAYENLSWSVRTSTWQELLYIKRRVARPNFKLCLDTYHILTKLWGDCTVPSGRLHNGDAALEADFRRMVHEIRPEEVGFVQLSDAEHMKPPIAPAELRKQGKHYAEYWSAVGRLFPLETEEGAYLPMVGLCHTWLAELGWTGWVSMETFYKTMADEERRPDHWAKRGVDSWAKLKKQMESYEIADVQVPEKGRI